MSDFYTVAITRKARKLTKCTFCAESIASGDQYIFQKGNHEGRWFESKFHDECFDALCERGEGEYIPYANDRPEQHEAKGWA